MRFGTLIPNTFEVLRLYFHVEGRFTFKGPRWRLNYDWASGRTGRYLGRDFEWRFDRKRRRHAIESDGCCSRKIRSQDVDGRSHRARDRQRLDEWSKFHRQAVDRSAAKRADIVDGAACKGLRVEVAVGSLNQTRVRIGAICRVKVVLCRKRAAWGDLEDRPEIGVCPTIGSGAVEIPIRPLDQIRNWVVAIGFLEAVQRRHFTGWRHLEDPTVRTGRGRSSEVSLTVEVPIAAEDKTGEWIGTICVVKLVHHGEFSR